MSKVVILHSELNLEEQLNWRTRTRKLCSLVLIKSELRLPIQTLTVFKYWDNHLASSLLSHSPILTDSREGYHDQWYYLKAAGRSRKTRTDTPLWYKYYPQLSATRINTDSIISPILKLNWKKFRPHLCCIWSCNLNTFSKIFPKMGGLKTGWKLSRTVHPRIYSPPHELSHMSPSDNLN